KFSDSDHLQPLTLLVLKLLLILSEAVVASLGSELRF
ncbi:hypothetical protein A2U01_0088354, partial [Trifolium medium]|nr:hypothetical protein [Trifolium medium]